MLFLIWTMIMYILIAFQGLLAYVTWPEYPMYFLGALFFFMLWGATAVNRRQ